MAYQEQYTGELEKLSRRALKIMRRNTPYIVFTDDKGRIEIFRPDLHDALIAKTPSYIPV